MWFKIQHEQKIFSEYLNDNSKVFFAFHCIDSGHIPALGSNWYPVTVAHKSADSSWPFSANWCSPTRKPTLVCCSEITLKSTSWLSIVCRGSGALTADPWILLSHMMGRRQSRRRRVLLFAIKAVPSRLFTYFFSLLKMASIHTHARIIPALHSECLFLLRLDVSCQYDWSRVKNLCFQNFIQSPTARRSVLWLWNPVELSVCQRRSLFSVTIMSCPLCAFFFSFVCCLNVVSDNSVSSRSRQFCCDIDGMWSLKVLGCLCLGKLWKPTSSHETTGSALSNPPQAHFPAISLRGTPHAHKNVASIFTL